MTVRVRLTLAALLGAVACAPRHYNDAPAALAGPEGVVEALVSIQSAMRGTGLLIHPKIILTAAHVAPGTRRAAVAWATGSATVHPRDIVAHEEFRLINGNEASKSDIALLFLREPAKIAFHATIPSLHEDFMEPEASAIVAGRGMLSAFLPRVLGFRIRELASEEKEIRLETLKRGKGMCEGDSGGPVFVPARKLLLVGLVAYGTCDEGRVATTDVVAHLPWMRHELAKRGFALSPTTGEIVEIKGVGGSPAIPSFLGTSREN